MMPVIQTRGLTKDFGNGKGLFDLDLDVERGRVHGFLGPNGAGKTTCMRVLLDFLRPTRGAARVFAHDPQMDAAGVRRRVGYMPGELSLPEHINGQRFLDDSAALRGGVDLEWRAHLVEQFGAQLKPKIRTLSKGNKQKIALLDALQHRAPLWVLDEPTDGLDPLLRHRVHDILRDHARGGGTVFLSSHVVHEIQTTCDDVSIVLNGRLRRQDRVLQMLAKEPTRIRCRLPDLRGARELLGQVPGIARLRRHDDEVRFQLRGDILPAMQALIRLRAEDVVVRQHDLEETFLELYAEAE